ncbi:MAG: carboxypeptidase regulatory-like domain-containing protein [Acidobacteriota bacterium]|nr:carboxypeptidase regulatory-like domain-containing protein [Acidobacteriota bacterium]
MKRVFGRLLFSAICLSLLTFTFAAGGFAQDLDDVTISGKVADTTGAAILGASITATQIEKNIERTVVTNDEGRYRIVELEPGTYKVRATAPGFGAKEQIDLVTVAGQNVQLDFSLAPAGVQVEQTVTIGGDDAPLVDTTRTIVGGTITEREVEELPNNTRNPLDLVLTLGGTSEEALSTRDLAEDRNSNPRSTPSEQGNFSLSGGASYSNNITIDGLDNNDDRSARDRFQPSLESIAEVQVIRNQFSAEYGRASGGRINLRTRAGTNNFRGRAFMFFRDDNLNANTWYNNSRGIARLPYTEYNPGFTFSGPVILPFGEGDFLYDGRDKTFFSVAYEHNQLQDTTLIDTYVPLGSNPRFALPVTTGGTPTCDNANPNACAPTDGSAPTAAFVAPYRVTLPTPNTNNTLTARIDHKLFKGNDITFGWQYGRRNNRRQTGASTTRIEDALQNRNSNTDAFNITDNQVFGPYAVNQFRFQWSRFEPSYQTDNPMAPVILISYRNPVTNGVQTLIAGNSTASSLQNFADSRKEVRLQFQDSLTYVVGAHTLKGGFDIQNVNSRAIALGDATGTYNFGSVLNFQNNVLSRYRQNFGTASDVKNTYWGAFINDEMRAASNLTVSYGVRYERETAISDNNNFGPRLGIAWDPFGNGKGVVRFGTGIFYNRVLLRTVGDFVQNSLGSLVSFDSNTIPTTNNARANVLARIAEQFPNSYASVEALRNAIASANCGTTTSPVPCSPNTGFLNNSGSGANPLRSIDPNLRIPESYQFNIGFEREIGKGFVFEANYTWNKTAFLWREYNINAPVVPAGYADLTAYLVANTFTFTNANGTVRTYRFGLGPTNDGSGVSTTLGGTTACSTTANVICFVNLNTINSSTTAPSTNTGTGVSTNSIGGPIGIALEAVRNLRPDPSVDEKERVSSIGNSFYHGLVLEFRRRYRKLGYGFGASMRAVYTLSSMKDDGLNNTSNAEIGADFSREWARSLQDRRHRFAMTGTFDTPYWLGKLRFSPVFRFGSSAPFNLGYGIDRNLNDVSTDRVIFNGNPDDLIWREPGSPVPTALLSQFALQPIGARGGNLPRNAGKGPKQYIFDLSVTREWKFGERFRLRPILEFGNILNMAVFSFGSEFIDFIATPASPTPAQQLALQNFLVPTRTYRPREIRAGLRFDF